MKYLIKNFTLMECIAIIVIIILLITIFLPVYLKSREFGKSIACKNNLKILAEASISYAVNYAGIMPIGMTVPFVANFFQDFRTSVSATPKGKKVIIKNPDKYLPTPKLISAGATASESGAGCGYTISFPGAYPADYSSPLACPAQKTEWRNELLTRQLGITSSTNATFAWMGTNYANSGLGRLGTVKTMDKHVLYADSYAPIFLNNTVYLVDAHIYGRHFGTPVFQASSWSSLWTSNHAYEYHGPGTSNMIMWDGHVEAWTWASVYQHWNWTYCPFNAVSYSISYH